MLGRLLTRKEQLALLAIAAMVCVGGISLHARNLWASAERLNEGTVASGAGVAPEVPAAVVSSPTIPVGGNDSVQKMAPLEAMPNSQQPETPVPSASSSLAESDVGRPAGESERKKTIRVAVTGAVHTPGVYSLDSEGRVQDLIERAKGASEDADLSDINLASRLIDGSTLDVPLRGTARVEDQRLTIRGGRPAALSNPPQYTVSGWRQRQEVPYVAASNPPGRVSGTAKGAKTQGLSAPIGESRTPSGGVVNVNQANQQELEALPGIGPKLAQEIMAARAQQPFQNVDDLRRVKGIGPKRLEAIRTLVTVQ